MKGARTRVDPGPSSSNSFLTASMNSQKTNMTWPHSMFGVTLGYEADCRCAQSLPGNKRKRL